MFNQVINQCNNNISLMNCCHDDGRHCYCYDNCIKPGFYEGGLDTYDCRKKLNFYVLKYGPSYISEIYYYLSASKLAEIFQGNHINILSLGCGFSPDYYAITQYISDNNLSLGFQYYGWDISPQWQPTRLSLPNINYHTVDLLNPFSFENSHIIILNKVFSTIFRHKNHIAFLSNLADAIKKTMSQGSVLLFNDINNYKTGRDIFDNYIAPFFNSTSIRRYYYGDPDHPACKGYGTWFNIPQGAMIYPTDYSPNIDPINSIRQNVFFEYRK